MISITTRISVVFLVLLCQNIFCDAQDKDKDLFRPHEFLFGVNLTQCLAGDFEWYSMYCISKRHAVTIGAGYDKNFLDFGRHWDIDDQGSVDGSEGESNDAGRYFWGSGPSFRLNYDYAFSSARDNQNNFISVSAIFKMRSYRNYYFGAGISHSESADQTIYGLTFSVGKNIRWKLLMTRLYAGGGFRHLESNIHWPGYSSYLIPMDFTYNLTVPSLDFGVVLFLGTKPDD